MYLLLICKNENVVTLIKPTRVLRFKSSRTHNAKWAAVDFKCLKVQLRVSVSPVTKGWKTVAKAAVPKMQHTRWYSQSNWQTGGSSMITASLSAGVCEHETQKWTGGRWWVAEGVANHVNVPSPDGRQKTTEGGQREQIPTRVSPKWRWSKKKSLWNWFHFPI